MNTENNSGFASRVTWIALDRFLQRQALRTAPCAPISNTHTSLPGSPSSYRHYLDASPRRTACSVRVHGDGLQATRPPPAPRALGIADQQPYSAAELQAFGRSSRWDKTTPPFEVKYQVLPARERPCP